MSPFHRPKAVRAYCGSSSHWRIQALGHEKIQYIKKLVLTGKVLLGPAVCFLLSHHSSLSRLPLSLLHSQLQVVFITPGKQYCIFTFWLIFPLRNSSWHPSSHLKQHIAVCLAVMHRVMLVCLDVKAVAGNGLSSNNWTAITAPDGFNRAVCCCVNTGA